MGIGEVKDIHRRVVFRSKGPVLHSQDAVSMAYLGEGEQQWDLVAPYEMIIATLVGVPKSTVILCEVSSRLVCFAGFFFSVRACTQKACGSPVGVLLLSAGRSRWPRSFAGPSLPRVGARNES